MILKILAFLVTIGAAVLAFAVHQQDALHFDLLGHSFFALSAVEIFVLWAIVMVVLALVARVAHHRPRAVPMLAAAALLLVLGCALALRRPQAETIDLTQIDAAQVDDAPPAARKTLLLGIDGMTWTRIAPLAQAGRLPHIARLMEDGSYGVLESYRSYRKSVDADGYWSPVVWTTLATGVGVERHGISDFTIESADGKVRPALTWHRRAPAFWNIWSAFSRKVGVVGWWATWPAEEIDGIVVSSGVGLRGHRGIRGIQLDDKAWFRKRRKLTYPEAYKHIIAEEIGLPTDIDVFINREIFPFDQYMVRDSSDLQTIRSVLWQDRLYLDITKHLLATEDFSLYAVYLEGIDVLSHQFWEFMAYPDSLSAPLRFSLPPGFDQHTKVVDRYYEIVDDYIGQLVAAAGPETTVLIVSDHGFATAPEHPRRADHDPAGVFLARGAGIRAGDSQNLTLRGSLYSAIHGQISVMDILPTLLYLHDLPVADDLEGKVLYRLMDSSYISDHPRIEVDSYGDFEASRKVEIEIDTEDEDEYMERLRSLGYVD